MIRLANSPAPHVTNMAPSVLDMFCVTTSSAQLNRPIAAPEPSTGPNVAGVASPGVNKATISPDDWDDLFHAIAKRLETCVDEASNNLLVLPLPRRHAATKAAVLECVASMKQLHASLILERQLQHRR